MNLPATGSTPESPTPRAASPTARPLLHSAIKLATLGGLVLLMLIPVTSLLGLVWERQQRAGEARRAIETVGGGAQRLGATVLTLPYRTVEDGRMVERRAYVLPAEVHWRGELVPSRYRRGIFEITVYEARLRATGHFAPADFAELGLDPAQVAWDRATLTAGVSHPQGIQGRVRLAWDGQELPVGPGGRVPEVLPAGLAGRLGVASRSLLEAQRTFSLELVVRGTETLELLPLGEVTTAQLDSPWPDPSFGGAFLPRERTVGDEGFSARWEVAGLAFPRAWTGNGPGNLEVAAERSAFGVILIRTADHYQRVERAVKYAVLFIVLTFTTLVLLELFSPARLHPVHYLLVGFALCLFYLLLLALSEHVRFVAAYAVAAGAIVLQVGLYARAILRSWRLAGIAAGTIALLYGYLYSLLTASDYALLMGAVGLFCALAAVMYLTRRLDWWTLRFEEEPVT